MKQCGNEVLTPENEDEFTVDVLYNILCRQESSDIPLPQRVQDVVSSYIAAGKDTDAIPCTEFLHRRRWTLPTPNTFAWTGNIGHIF